MRWSKRAEWLHSHSRQTWCMCISTGAQGRKPSVDAVRNSLYPLNLLYFHTLDQECLWLCKLIEHKPFVRFALSSLEEINEWIFTIEGKDVHRSINICLGTPLLSTRSYLYYCIVMENPTHFANRFFNESNPAAFLRHDIIVASTIQLTNHLIKPKYNVWMYIIKVSLL